MSFVNYRAAGLLPVYAWITLSTVWSLTCMTIRRLAVSRFFFFSSRRRHTRCLSHWSSDVCSSDLEPRRARRAHDGDLVAVRGDAADGHDITQVPVRHERGALGAARDVAELLERVGLVGTEDFNVIHSPHPLTPSPFGEGERNVRILSCRDERDSQPAGSPRRLVYQSISQSDGSSGASCCRSSLKRRHSPRIAGDDCRSALINSARRRTRAPRRSTKQIQRRRGQRSSSLSTNSTIRRLIIQSPA